MNWKFSRSLCCLFIFSRLNPGRCRYQWQRQQLQSISLLRTAFPESFLSPILIELQPMCQRERQQQTEVSFYLTLTENGATAENCLVWRLRAQSQWKSHINKIRLSSGSLPSHILHCCLLNLADWKPKKGQLSYSVSFTLYACSWVFLHACSSNTVSWSTKTGEPQSTAKLVALSQYAEQVQDTKVRLMLIMFVLFYLSS